MQRAVEEDDAGFVQSQIAAGGASADTVLMHVRGTPCLAELAIQRGSLRVLAFLLASRVSLAPNRVTAMHESLALSRDPDGVLRAFADSRHPAKGVFLENIPADVLARITISQETFEHIREKNGLLVVAQNAPVEPRDERDGETKSGTTLITFGSLASSFLQEP
jgi:hypothetical protein